MSSSAVHSPPPSHPFPSLGAVIQVLSVLFGSASFFVCAAILSGAHPINSGDDDAARALCCFTGGGVAWKRGVLLSGFY